MLPEMYAFFFSLAIGAIFSAVAWDRVLIVILLIGITCYTMLSVLFSVPYDALILRVLLLFAGSGLGYLIGRGLRSK